MINRKQILQCFLENISGISDAKYQQRVWVKAEGPECDSIDDTIGDFFEECEYIVKDYKKYGIKEDQLQYLVRLDTLLEEFCDKHDVYYSAIPTDKLINLPEWQIIRDQAKKVTVAFS